MLPELSEASRRPYAPGVGGARRVGLLPSWVALWLNAPRGGQVGALLSLGDQ